MSENTSPQPVAGMFGWNELITSDIEGAKKFYSEVFGWTTEKKNIAPGWDYHMFKNGETMVGGMFGITPEMGPMPSHWLAYVMSEDIDADVAKATAAGGRIIKDKMVVPEVGCLAIIQDPQGAVIAIWKCDATAKCES